MAREQEYDIYPELYEKVEAHLGAAPQTVITDKGFAVRKVFEHNTRRGVATVSPQRGNVHDTELTDRHGVARCPHCGSGATFVRFAHKPSPRLWFTCDAGLTDRCAPKRPGGKPRQLSKACSADWRQMLPLRRTDPIFHELSTRRGLHERSHRHWRERYLVAGDTLANRPKRRGLAVQRLRAAGALLIEWLRICARHCWLPGHTRTYRQPVKRLRKAAKAAVDKLIAARRDAGLHLPYGPAAVAAGFPAAGTPPSRR